MSGDDATARTRSALRGAFVEPPVVGLSFVPPEVLSTGGGMPADPAAALAEAVDGAGLDFAFVPGDAPWAADAAGRMASSGRAALWVVGGVLWPALRSVGVNEGLRHTVADPEALRPAMDEAAAAAAAQVKEAVSAGAAGIVVADDLAGQDGLLVAPDFVLDDLVPRYMKATLAARAADMPSLMHSDGDIRALVDGLAGAGFHALHLGGITADIFARSAAVARADGLATAGGLGEEAWGRGLAVAVREGASAGVLAAAGGMLVADDGGVTTREQFAALIEALVAARGSSGPAPDGIAEKGGAA